MTVRKLNIRHQRRQIICEIFHKVLAAGRRINRFLNTAILVVKAERSGVGMGQTNAPSLPLPIFQLRLNQNRVNLDLVCPGDLRPSLHT